MTINRGAIKHWVKLLLLPEYRNYCYQDNLLQGIEWLKKVPRYTPVSTNILEKTLQLVDGRSFYYSYKEIFQEEIYKFKTEKESPLIIDCGSNIGLSIIFFKKLYPNSKIIGFEADPKVYKILKLNLETFEYYDVEVYNKALWNQETIIEFESEGADSGRVTTENNELKKVKIRIPAIPLSTYLSEPVDFLKIDIEGAETIVLKECAEHLHNVNNIFIEYHSFLNDPQTLDEILSILKKANFRFTIHNPSDSSQPFIKRRVYQGMDLQLNIFAYRVV